MGMVDIADHQSGRLQMDLEGLVMNASSLDQDGAAQQQPQSV
jgi:hypothetical protein